MHITDYSCNDLIRYSINYYLTRCKRHLPIPKCSQSCLFHQNTLFCLAVIVCKGWHSKEKKKHRRRARGGLHLYTACSTGPWASCKNHSINKLGHQGLQEMKNESIFEVCTGSMGYDSGPGILWSDIIWDGNCDDRLSECECGLL